CSDAQREELLTHARAALAQAHLGQQVLWVDIHRLSPVERLLLVERHLMSKEHAKGEAARGLAVSLPDERLSLMVNEEDHLRLQVLRSGLALSDAYRQLDEADDRLEEHLDYAYSPRFGYLTACPTNVGTASRMSVMLHLPSLRLVGDIDKVKRAAKDMGLALRGFYGEGSEAAGDLYQVSNQVTLGKPESVFLHELEREIIPRVVEYERTARAALIEKRRRFTEDSVWRALGVLRTARLLTPDEAMSLLSLTRLGVVSGLVSGVSEQAVTQLWVQVQQAHLQRAAGCELDQQRRRELRADLVRERLN
ncbi:MAG: ATP--guanido phosphotransferase, partial [Phycisphaerales bacterium]|nr:ATP--guanido phosphotransferase [Phycisphaerales bacterium]